MFGNRLKRKKIGKGGGQKHEIGHFINVQNAKGTPDFFDKVYKKGFRYFFCCHNIETNVNFGNRFATKSTEKICL